MLIVGILVDLYTWHDKWQKVAKKETNLFESLLQNPDNHHINDFNFHGAW